MVERQPGAAGGKVDETSGFSVSEGAFKDQTLKNLRMASTSKGRLYWRG